jgi:UDP-N-acetylglucosamine 4,6-dehydratase
MITKTDSRHTLEFDNYYIIKPEYDWWNKKNHEDGQPVEDGFEYNSGDNEDWLSIEEMRRIIEELSL